MSSRLLEAADVLDVDLHDDVTCRVADLVQEVAEEFGFDRNDKEVLKEIAGIVEDSANYLAEK